jgi:hypothetical protein
LFVFADSTGQEWVSAALPGSADASAIRRFRASGPYMPIGWPKPTQVGNASAWMADHENKGFTFTPMAM